MPFKRSEQPVLMRTLAVALLNTLSTDPAAALLDTPTVHLFTDGPLTITPTNVVADFTEADFVGYAEAALPALTVPLNLGVSYLGKTGGVNFVAGAVVAPGQTVNGYYVTDDTGATLYMAERFTTGVQFVNPGDFLGLDVVFGATMFPLLQGLG